MSLDYEEGLQMKNLQKSFAVVVLLLVIAVRAVAGGMETGYTTSTIQTTAVQWSEVLLNIVQSLFLTF